MYLDKSLRIILIIIILQSFLFAQVEHYTISGIVTNSASNQPLPGVLVEVINEADTAEQASAVSDSTGKYSINLIVSGFQQTVDQLPAEFQLKQNYPNPFNPSTKIEFYLSEISDVQLAVYNSLGQKIKTIIQQKLTAGVYTAAWDGTSEAGAGVAAGVYFYRLYANTSVKTRKMVLLDGAPGEVQNNSAPIRKKRNRENQLAKIQTLQVTIRAASPLVHTFEQKNVNISEQNLKFDIAVNLYLGYLDPEKIVVSEPGLNGEIYISGLPRTVTDTTDGLKEVSAQNIRTYDINTTGVYRHGGFPIVVMDANAGDILNVSLQSDGQIVGDQIEITVKPDMKPFVIYSKPTNGDKDILVDGVISIDFSEPVDSTTVSDSSVTLTDSLGKKIPGVIGFRNKYTSIFFDPDQPLMPFTTYTISVGSEVADLQGLNLGTNYTVTFTTGFWSTINFTKYPDNPVMSGGAEGSWDRHVVMAHVLYNQDSARYEMWFGGSKDDKWSYKIGFATSWDGISWKKYPDPVLIPTPGTWDAQTVFSPTVIYENGLYKMWYTGWRSPADLSQIGCATSPDGIHWTKDTLNNPVFNPGTAGWEAGGPAYCDIKFDQGIYKMWYTGWSADYVRSSIGYAVSNDGISWQRISNEPVLYKGTQHEWDGKFAVFPKILIEKGIYFLWYCGVAYISESSGYRIGLAISTDGIHWTKYDDTNTTSLVYASSDPVLIPGTWDGSYVQPANILLINNTYYMWYSGSREITDYNLWRIGLATAPYNITGVINEFKNINK